MIQTRARWTGGPAGILGFYFLLPAVLFLTIWYGEYLSPVVRQALIGIFGLASLLLPAMLTWWLASFERRRRFLWATLVLAGSSLALWLPMRELVLAGPLPPRAYTLLPDLLRQTVALTFVALIPILMGGIPGTLYALGVGQVRPVAGGVSPVSISLVYLFGAVLCAGALLLGLLNPGPPPLFDARPSTEVVLQTALPPSTERKSIQAGWHTVLWRLRDSIPPGALRIASGETQLTLGLPPAGNLDNTLSIATARGFVELVNIGRARIQPGTQIATSWHPGTGVDEPFPTLVTGAALQGLQHWSGMTVRDVRLTSSPSDRPVLLLFLDSDGAQALQTFMDDHAGNYLAVVIDGVVLHSVRVQQPIEQGKFTLRGLDQESARLLLYLLRYGPLPAPLTLERVGRPE